MGIRFSCLCLALHAVGCATGPRDRAARASDAVPASGKPEAPTTTDVLVWTRPQADPALDATTYWLAIGASGYEIKGKTKELLVAVGGEVWRWSTQESHAPPDCDDPELKSMLEDSKFVAASVDSLESGQHVEVVKRDTTPPKCSSIMDSTVSLLGSVDGCLFVDSSYYDYSGGAHGVNQRDFEIFDVAARSPWRGWEKEAVVADAEIEPLKRSLMDEAGETTDGERPYVNLTPTLAKPSYERARLVLDVCFVVTGTNIDGLSLALSRGPMQLPDCVRASIPPRFAPFASAPGDIETFARTEKLVIGGWSALPPSRAMPEAVQLRFTQ